QVVRSVFIEVEKGIVRSGLQVFPRGLHGQRREKVFFERSLYLLRVTHDRRRTAERSIGLGKEVEEAGIFRRLPKHLQIGLDTFAVELLAGMLGILNKKPKAAARQFTDLGIGLVGENVVVFANSLLVEALLGALVGLKEVADRNIAATFHGLGELGI